MSVETYEGFQFRYCWDVDHLDTIRIYVEKRPPNAQHLLPKDICLNPAMDGAPEHIKFPDERRVSLFPEAQMVAHEWAKRVIKVAMSNSTPAKAAREESS